MHSPQSPSVKPTSSIPCACCWQGGGLSQDSLSLVDPESHTVLVLVLHVPQPAPPLPPGRVIPLTLLEKFTATSPFLTTVRLLVPPKPPPDVRTLPPVRRVAATSEPPSLFKLTSALIPLNVAKFGPALRTRPPVVTLTASAARAWSTRSRLGRNSAVPLPKARPAASIKACCLLASACARPNCFLAFTSTSFSFASA
jgi:hypothetical protein